VISLLWLDTGLTSLHFDKTKLVDSQNVYYQSSNFTYSFYLRKPSPGLLRFRMECLWADFILPIQ
jgi:hypothetical protein